MNLLDLCVEALNSEEVINIYVKEVIDTFEDTKAYTEDYEGELELFGDSESIRDSLTAFTDYPDSQFSDVDFEDWVDYHVTNYVTFHL